ncbi:helix-turn-helix transcriptional regulator [Burkholderia sp. MR1-5-21]
MLDDVKSSVGCQEYAKRTASFLKNTIGCSAVLFTWHERDSIQSPHVLIGADERMLDEYYEFYSTKDPLQTEVLIRNFSTVETLSNATRGYDHNLMEEYSPFLRKYNLSDEVDFIFWAGGKAVASAALLQTDSLRFEIDPDRLKEMQQYLQYTFSFVPAVKNLSLKECLADRYKLTPKEQTVVELMISGESNKSIANFLDVELATIKTHLIHIFQKLQVQSRSKAIALLTGS